jgi:hypothetical protein
VSIICRTEGKPLSRTFGSVDGQDRTENMAMSARNWREARAARSEDLGRIEGAETFEGQQTFLDVAARLAGERRLSRIAFRAVKPHA